MRHRTRDSSYVGHFLTQLFDDVRGQFVVIALIEQPAGYLSERRAAWYRRRPAYSVGLLELSALGILRSLEPPPSVGFVAGGPAWDRRMSRFGCTEVKTVFNRWSMSPRWESW